MNNCGADNPRKLREKFGYSLRHLEDRIRVEVKGYEKDDVETSKLIFGYF
jgi:hypothetical protein